MFRDEQKEMDTLLEKYVRLRSYAFCPADQWDIDLLQLEDSLARDDLLQFALYFRRACVRLHLETFAKNQVAALPFSQRKSRLNNFWALQGVIIHHEYLEIHRSASTFRVARKISQGMNLALQDVMHDPEAQTFPPIVFAISDQSIVHFELRSFLGLFGDRI
jgi:hypothetical protein